MIVTSSLDSIDLVLGANVTTNQLHINASYNRISSTSVTPVKNCTTSSNTTAVNIVPAPSSGNQHQLKYCNIFNADSAQSTVTVRTSYNGTTKNVISTTLQVNEYLQYTHKTGWKAFDVNGSTKIFNTNSPIVSNPIIPEFSLSQAATSLQLATTTYCYYIGKATGAHKNIVISFYISAQAATVTWAEAAIYKGTPSLGSTTTLTRCGFIDASAPWARNGVAPIANYIPVTGINAGDDLWLVLGNSAVTSVSFRSNSVPDNISAGFFLTAGSSRPSLSSSLSSTTISTTATPPRITWMGD